VAAITLVAAVVLGMLVGILTAVISSLALLLARISRPRDALLGSAAGVEGFYEIEGGEELEAAFGVLVYRRASRGVSFARTTRAVFEQMSDAGVVSEIGAERFAPR
jgi:MFS superfamily sulfate permease-like transporter